MVVVASAGSSVECARVIDGIPTLVSVTTNPDDIPAASITELMLAVSAIPALMTVVNTSSDVLAVSGSLISY